MLLAVFAFSHNRHNTYVHIKPSDKQFIEDDILHQMRLLVLTEIDTGVAKTRVGEVVFIGSIDVLPSLHVISHRLFYEKRVTQELQIGLHGLWGDGHILDALECVDQFCRIGETANRGRYDVQQLFEFFFMTYFVTLLDVLDISLDKEILQI